MPTELEAELRFIRLKFILEMTRIVREIAVMVSRELKAAKEEVKTGRAQIKSKIDSLGDDQTELKAELTKEFDEKFDALEGDIKAARNAVVAGVAERYKKSLAATDRRSRARSERSRRQRPTPSAGGGVKVIRFGAVKLIHPFVQWCRDRVYRLLASLVLGVVGAGSAAVAGPSLAPRFRIL